MKNKNGFISVIIGILFSIICITSYADSGKDTIKIAAILAKTGKAGPSKVFHYKLINFAIDEINAKGGVLGKKIELMEIDNQSTPLGSKSAAEKAVNAGAIAVIGPTSSSRSLGAAPVLQKAKIPMITPSATNPKVTLIGDYIYRACYIDPFQGTIMASYAIKKLKAESAVVLTNAGNWFSVDLSNFFIRNYKKQGGKILWKSDYSADEVNFKTPLEKIKNLKPDIIFVPGYDRDSGFIIKQARKMGITAPFLGGDGWNLAMYKYGDEAIDGSLFSSHWHRDDPREISKKFLSRFEKSHGEIKTTPLAYDVVYLIADAIKRANSSAPEKVKEALAKTRYFEGVTGEITFDENGDPINKPAVILKFENGEKKYIETIKP